MIAAEAVGQDQIGAGTDEALVARPDAIGILELPRVGYSPRLEPEGEQGGAYGRRRRPRPAGGPGRSVADETRFSGQRRFQSVPTGARRRRGRLSATLVRPAARRRARRRCTIARRSASPAPGHAAISSSVRMQPAHRPVPGSSRHTPMQGEGISISRRLSVFDSGRSCAGGRSLAGSDRARAGRAQATQAVRHPTQGRRRHRSSSSIDSRPPGAPARFAVAADSD
jgi:hypothetical protein